MQQAETSGSAVGHPAGKGNTTAAGTNHPPDPGIRIGPQGGGSHCSCGGTGAPAAGPAPSYVFSLGRVEPRFRSLGVEKEFAQATGRAETNSLTDRQALHAVLSQRENRYLARQLCWVLNIAGMDTYLLYPRDPGDVQLLIDAVRPRPGPGDLDVVIGVRGSVAPPEMCNGLLVPVVAFDQLYSFGRDELLASIPRPKEIPLDQEEAFRSSVGELFDRFLQLADNAGATDEHRALNYLAVRYPAIYAKTAEAHAHNSSLSAVEVRPFRLSGTRKVVDVVCSYTHRTTDVTDKYFVRVDVTEEFPFLVTKLAPFFDR